MQWIAPSAKDMAHGHTREEAARAIQAALQLALETYADRAKLIRTIPPVKRRQLASVNKVTTTHELAAWAESQLPANAAKARARKKISQQPTQTMGEALDLLEAEFGRVKTAVTAGELETSRRLHAARKAHG